MDTRNLVVGSRIEHELHGSGTVTFVGTEYLGVSFDHGSKTLLLRETLERNAPVAWPQDGPPRETLPWPDSTFVFEGEDARHFMGAHWNPFVQDSGEIIKRLPEMLPKALSQRGYGYDHQSPRAEPDHWPIGFQLVWPLRTHGLAVVVRPGSEVDSVVTLFPFFATGSRHTLTLREVRVWDEGLEAQIAAGWGEGQVTFFDTQYVINRAWYVAGREYDFVLSGIAYSAGPAERREWQINRHPDEVAWVNQRLKNGEECHETTSTMTLDGAAVFLPGSEWDVDDYSFHAPVKSVEEFKDWLGQDGWRVRATVMRFGHEDADLDILVTRKSWSGNAAPRVGEDIEGRLWLQGYLLTPG